MTRSAPLCANQPCPVKATCEREGKCAWQICLDSAEGVHTIERGLAPWERRLFELQQKATLTPGEQREIDVLIQKKWGKP